MKIFKDSITQRASQGDIELQIGEVAIGTPMTYEEVPDEWLMWLRHDHRVTDGGFLHLSRKGWEANKDKIKKAFEAAPNKSFHWSWRWRDNKYCTMQPTWKDYEDFAEEFYAMVDNKTKTYKEKMLSKLKDKQTKIRSIPDA